MAIKLKEEVILNEWATILEEAAGHSEAVLEGIGERLKNSRIPGDCSWYVYEVKSEHLIGRVRRNMMIVKLRQFRDYRIYIGIRDYGAHLDCCRFLTLEPGLLKRWLSVKLTGYGESLSVPKNILVHQDLRAWTTVVHHSVLDSVEELMKKLGKDPTTLHRGSKGFLEIW